MKIFQRNCENILIIEMVCNSIRVETGNTLEQIFVDFPGRFSPSGTRVVVDDERC